jgi:hypothetical protein
MILVEKLLASLPDNSPGLFHPWHDRCEFDLDGPDCGPAGRLARLKRHLDCDSKLLLIGEACGYQGCRYSGIAFTSERLLLEGVIPRVAPPKSRLSSRKKPFSEPSATIVWKTLHRLGVAEKTVLWNALPLHPYRPGFPWSNRTPKDAELALGAEALRVLIGAFPGAMVVAVGRKAELALRALAIGFQAAVRHPANGGATAFAEGLSRALKL